MKNGVNRVIVERKRSLGNLSSPRPLKAPPNSTFLFQHLFFYFGWLYRSNTRKPSDKDATMAQKATI